MLTVGTTAAFVMAAHRGALMVGAVWLFYVGFQTVLLLVNESGPALTPTIDLNPVLGGTLFLFAFVLAARSLARVFRAPQ